jgi:predicted heme/steroid binding protein/uncharacterized membrane protein
MVRNREFTLEELSTFNGQNGQPAYVAYQGRVIDVGGSKRWPKGAHMNRHQAGRDLTDELSAAPHDTSVLNRLPQIGVLKTEKQDFGPKMPAFFKSLIETFPALRRHPHPMAVHFPIVFMMSSSAFTFLYLALGVKSFGTTALHMLGAGIFFTLVAMASGFLTWWLNYMARPRKEVIIKIVVSTIMLISASIAFVWRLVDPSVLEQVGGFNLIYVILVLLLLPEVSIVGYYGAQLTFPTHGGRKK